MLALVKPVKLLSVTTEPVCVVVPLTDKLPVTVRLLPTVTLLGRPTVIVPLLSATSTSLEVPEKVIVPPEAIALELEPSDTVTVLPTAKSIVPSLSS